MNFELWTLIVFCFLTYSYNGLAPQLVPELIEAGVRVYIKKERKKVTIISTKLQKVQINNKKNYR